MAEEDLRERNKEIVVRSLELLMGKGGAELAHEVLAPDYTDHNAEGDRGPERVLRVAEQARRAFPDLGYEIEEVMAEGDLVAFRLLMHGTHRGPLPGMGLPGTGRRVSVRQIHMARVRDGKVAEHWAVRDDLGMLIQLGALGPGQKPAVRPDGAADGDDGAAAPAARETEAS